MRTPHDNQTPERVLRIQKARADNPDLSRRLLAERFGISRGQLAHALSARAKLYGVSA